MLFHLRRRHYRADIYAMGVFGRRQFSWMRLEGSRRERVDTKQGPGLLRARRSCTKRRTSQLWGGGGRDTEQTKERMRLLWFEYEMSPIDSCLNTWSPAGVQESCRTCQWWHLTGGSLLVGSAFEDLYPGPLATQFLLPNHGHDGTRHLSLRTPCLPLHDELYLLEL